MRQTTPMQKSHVACLIAVLFGTALAGCTVLPRAPISPEAAGFEERGKNESIVGRTEEDVVPIAASNMFISIPAVGSDPMPDITVRRVSFSGSSPNEVIQSLVAGSGISVVFRNEAQNSMVLRHTVSATNISGKLQDVLNRLSDSVGFFYAYRNGVLEVTPDMQFIAEVPPVNAVFESLPQMLKALGATDIFLDKSARTLTYRATKPVHEKVSRYLNYIRETKSLIVYDTYIWEVILNDSRAMGIDWNRFNYTPSSKFGLSVNGAGGEIAGSIGVGVVYNTTSLALDVLAKFLKTQGTVKTISQPKLTMISGGTAMFRNGNSINYVSQVGTTTNASTTTTSVTTAQVLSGIDMLVSGDVSDGTVFTSVRISMNDLQRFNPFVAVGTQLQLPQTANREITTDVRTRSNDTILLAGINSSRVQGDIQGLPLGGPAIAPTSSTDKFERAEMVIVLKPRVIRFTNQVAKVTGQSQEVERPTEVGAKMPAAALASDAVVDAQTQSSSAQRGPRVTVMKRRLKEVGDQGGDQK